MDEATVVLPLAGLIDLAAERARLEKDRAKRAGRGARRSRASWTTPISSAARQPEVVEENRERLAGFEHEAARLGAAIARIALPPDVSSPSPISRQRITASPKEEQPC